MRFLTDHDVYQITIDFLVDHGHEVVRVKDVGLAQALLRCIENAGVILLRCGPTIINNTYNEFERFLDIHKDKSFKDCFVVIEPNRHRIRRSGLII
jgi:predicted nucleic acid-binding protein